MGAQARLYTSSGALKHSSSMVYNDNPVINIFAYSPRTSSSGYCYSQTKASFYNGNGYTTYTANKSPNAAVSTSLSNIDEYNVSTSNKTYGSGLLAEIIGEDPDLISAIGISGVEGYVRSDDLVPTPSSLEEAVSASNIVYSDRIIPLYDLSGDVIGEFVVSGMDKAELISISKFFEAK